MLNAPKTSLHNCNQILYETCSGNKEALLLHCYLGVSILLPVLEDSCCSGGRQKQPDDGVHLPYEVGNLDRAESSTF
jgi:hypothetical protein